MVYTDAPPIPERVTAPSGEVVFTGKDVTNGQLVFLKYALMANGSIWGHGALLGPDFSALYLHTLALHNANSIALARYGLPIERVTAVQRAMVEAEVRTGLKANLYDPQTKVLSVGPAYQDWFKGRTDEWIDYFSNPAPRPRPLSAPPTP